MNPIIRLASTERKSLQKELWNDDGKNVLHAVILQLLSFLSPHVFEPVTGLESRTRRLLLMAERKRWLTNGQDSLFPEWNDKVVGFIGYGSVSGARAIEKLRQVVVELKRVSIRLSLHLTSEIFLATLHEPAPLNPEVFQSMREGLFGDRVGSFLSELQTTAQMLKAHRQTISAQPTPV